MPTTVAATAVVRLALAEHDLEAAAAQVRLEAGLRWPQASTTLDLAAAEVRVRLSEVRASKASSAKRQLEGLCRDLRRQGLAASAEIYLELEADPVYRRPVLGC